MVAVEPEDEAPGGGAVPERAVPEGGPREAAAPGGDAPDQGAGRRPPGRGEREVPFWFDDDVRAGVATAASLPFLVVPYLRDLGDLDLLVLLPAACLTFSGFSLVFLVWTHLLFTRTPPAELARVAAVQARRRRSALARVLGSGGTVSLTTSVAAGALVVAVAAAVVGGRVGGAWLPTLVLVTVVTSWLTMVYAFALRYFRLHCGGDAVTFDIEEEPRFGDFVSMAVMVSSMAATSAGTPRTRAGLTAVRTHTFIAFVFNALIVAMTVSVLGGFIAGTTPG